MLITQARLRHLLVYDPETGIFTSRCFRGGLKPGDVVGSPHGGGYLQFMVDGHMQLAHRMAWLYVHGDLPDYIDHVNGLRKDNRIQNLRKCDAAENVHNGKAHRDGSSGVKGVSQATSGNGWYGEIMCRGSRHRKRFTDKDDAEKWVRDKRQELHREFSNHGERP